MRDLARARIEVADRIGVEDLLAALRAQHPPLRVDREARRVERRTRARVEQDVVEEAPRRLNG
jgi:hypothetical protein